MTRKTSKGVEGRKDNVRPYLEVKERDKEEQGESSFAAQKRESEGERIELSVDKALDISHL